VCVCVRVCVFGGGVVGRGSAKGTYKCYVTKGKGTYMSIVKVRNEVMFLEERWDVATRRPHKHVTFLIKKWGISIVKIRRDVTLLREERDMSIVRVRKAVGLLVQMGIFLY
jgi:hypothetical protein